MPPESPEPATRAGRAVFACLAQNPTATLSEIEEWTRAAGHGVDHKTAIKYRRAWRAYLERLRPTGPAPPAVPT